MDDCVATQLAAFGVLLCCSVRCVAVLQCPVRWSVEVSAIENCRKQCAAIGHPHLFVNKRTMAPVFYVRETPFSDSIFATFEYLQPEQVSAWSRRSARLHHDKFCRIGKSETLARLKESVKQCFSSVEVRHLTIVSEREYHQSHLHLHGEKGKPDIAALKRERAENLLYRRRRLALCSAGEAAATKTIQERILERKARRQRRYALPCRNQLTPISASEIKLILDSQRLSELLETSDRQHEMPPTAPPKPRSAAQHRFLSMPLRATDVY